MFRLPRTSNWVLHSHRRLGDVSFEDAGGTALEEAVEPRMGTGTVSAETLCNRYRSRLGEYPAATAATPALATTARTPSVFRGQSSFQRI